MGHVAAKQAYFVFAGHDTVAAGSHQFPYVRILLVRHDARTRGQAVREGTMGYAASIGTFIYDTFIRRAVAMGESQTNRMDIYTFNPKATVAKDYMAFVDEYLARKEW